MSQMKRTEIHILSINIHTTDEHHVIRRDLLNDTYVVDQLDYFGEGVDKHLIIHTADPSDSDLESIKRRLRLEALRILRAERDFYTTAANTVDNKIQKLIGRTYESNN